MAGSSGPEVPTLTGWPVVGVARALHRDYLGTIGRADRELGGLARIVAGPPGWRLVLYALTSPALIEDVLRRPEHFGKHHPGYRELRGALGDNVLTSEGDDWRRQRRFLAPMFTRHRVLTRYAPVMTEEAQALVTRWRPAAARGEPLDTYAEMVAMASRVSGRILFGADMSAAADLLTRFRRVNDQLLRRAVSPHPIPSFLPIPGNVRMNAGLRRTRGIVTQLITRRRAELAERGSRSGDLLEMLLVARDAEVPHDRLTDREVADQVMLFLLAGHDTTSVALTCALLLLALHPSWQERVRDEVDGALDGRPPVAADLPRMPWTARVVQEAMRLYPPAHGAGRAAQGDQLLGGCRVPAGAWVELSTWGVHHSARVWSDPESFDPSRFDVAEGERPGGHRCAYLPFGVGPRACIGSTIALTEIQLTLTTVLQTYVVATPLRRIPVHAAITLLPTGRVPVEVRFR